MSVIEIILGILILLLAIAITAVSILQEGHDAGLGAIAGGADSFFSKGKARSYDEILARGTKIGGIVLLVLIILINTIRFFM